MSRQHGLASTALIEKDEYVSHCHPLPVQRQYPIASWSLNHRMASSMNAARTRTAICWSSRSFRPLCATIHSHDLFQTHLPKTYGKRSNAAVVQVPGVKSMFMGRGYSPRLENWISSMHAGIRLTRNGTKRIMSEEGKRESPTVAKIHSSTVVFTMGGFHMRYSWVEISTPCLHSYTPS